jgi:hypothetical protein
MHKILGSSSLSSSFVTPTTSIEQKSIESVSHQKLDVGTFLPNQYKSCTHLAYHPDHRMRTNKFTCRRWFETPTVCSPGWGISRELDACTLGFLPISPALGSIRRRSISKKRTTQTFIVLKQGVVSTSY